MFDLSFLHLPNPRDVGMGVAMSDLLFQYLVGPHPRDAGICLLYFFALHDSIVHDVYIYIYIYMPARVWVIVHFV